MRWPFVIGISSVFAAYIAAVAYFGYDMISPVMNYFRVALIVGVFAIYIQIFNTLFKSKNPPPGDYLLMGIVLTWTAALGFAVSNEVGQFLGKSGSVWVNPTAGIFGVMMALGAWFHLRAAEVRTSINTGWAIIIGLIISIFIVFGADIFR